MRRPVKAGPLVFLSGQNASDYTTGVAPEARVPEGVPHHLNPMSLQSDYVLRNIAVIMEAAGSSIGHIVKVQSYTPSFEEFSGHLAVRRRYFSKDPPASTAIECGLVVPGCRVEIDAIGVIPQPPKTVFNTDRAPRPLAPYSQAVLAGPFLFLAGVLASDFKTGVAPEARTNPDFPWLDSPIRRQTEYVLKTIATILEASGSSLEKVVKAHVILTDMRDFLGFEEVWRRFFAKDPPARSTFQGGLVNPGMLVEVDVIALATEGGLRKEVIRTSRAPVPTLCESQAALAGPWVFTGGLMATDWQSAVAPEARIDPNFPRYRSRGTAQTDYILKNMQTILEVAGTSLDHVLKLWAFHTDLADVADSLEARRTAFPHPVAATTVQTPALPVPGCAILVDAIAVIPD
jgi:reactive intermediate/imine deaminase